MSKTPSAAVSRVEERNESSGGSREVGDQAVWSLSSCKPGFGVDQLRDNNTETYWQSDGPQPHLVNIQFRRKTLVDQLSIYTDFKLDESYTPNRISVRVGSHFHDLQELDVVELQEPSGWVNIPILQNNRQPIKTFFIQIAILSNHQNGRDTHLRQIKVHSPVRSTPVASVGLGGMFSSEHMLEMAHIR
ncbi:anaphase-promoting complex subunit 10-like isoform X1 [Varroa jacobsoni]|uniref:Anaphase-promoting complex subunit 10 n=1 Tax=Varroa destructor TaxID=109461 RepID=A0A7M7J734_VARDE|nr:anaphase-promoting complex subunit 10-like isoform X1 [Varroa destructor]XP_022709978.1 anaphase-promoting complex subunit 10-like isoform X1 [Varroa jacobsoni]